MKIVADRRDFKKFVLVSGDGDYKKVVDYLVKKGIFEKILFPNKKFASSLIKNWAPSISTTSKIPRSKRKSGTRIPKEKGSLGTGPFGSQFVWIRSYYRWNRNSLTRGKSVDFPWEISVSRVSW